MTTLDFKGDTHSLEQPTPFQAGSSRRPTCRMKNSLRLDHSTSLVEINDQLNNLPFGRFNHRLSLSFSIIMFWIIGRHCIASWNCSAICQLLLFIANLILSFRAQHTGTKGEDKAFWQLIEWVRRLSDLHFFVISVAFVPFY
ncbi:hypothetical protein H5410_030817 [Solanum commersonii]|uniref:Uncharacterized protein n=1 Tax=Solanum commersonii TaxID=4109 RepID=A0A9J5YI18_SOLCO|nr:hypothetical protein H5410_030817 [Solanum commersonii]